MPRVESFRRLVCRVLIGTTLVLTPLSGASAGAPTSPLQIGEVAWAGSSVSTADEWVELWNTGSTDLAVGGYSLRGGSDKPIFLPTDAVVPAKGAYLISNYADTDVKSTLGIPVGVVTTTISLSNSTLGLTLWDANDTQIDNAGDGTLPPAGNSGTIKATMIRNGATWVTATSSIGFDADRTELGTPGTCDGCVSDAIPEPEPPIVVEPAAVESTSTEGAPVTTSTEPLSEPAVDPVIDQIPGSTPTSTDTVPIDPVVDLVPTSTEPIIEPMTTEEPVASSTNTASETPGATELSVTPVEPMVEPIPEAPVEPTPVIETTTTTESAPVSSAPTVEATSTATSPTPTQPIEPPHYEYLRLNELMPNPESGSEWIEITSINTTSSIPLQGVTFYDAAGKIATVATGTIDVTTPFFRVDLSSARLNNDGDTVTVHAPTGEIMDGLAYTHSTKGWSWIRTPDAVGEWKLTMELTPGNTNVLVEEPPAPTPASSTPTAPAASPVTSTASSSLPTQPTAPAAPTHTSATIQSTPPKPTVTTPAPKSATSSSSSKKTAHSVAPKAATAKKPPATTVTKTTAAKKTTAKPKAATKTSSKTTLPTLITHRMANQESNAGIPVALMGTVGTPPGLLSGHYFILLSEDGRGLKVHVPTSRKLPNAGEAVRVVGVLSFNDEGVPSLGMRKDDALETATGLRTPQPRLVDLMSPSLEDAWSLVQVTGNVTAVKGQTVSLDLGDADINMVIKSSIGYRVSRLKVGDTLRVRGLVQLGDIAPELMPRSADDIDVVGHVNIVPATTKGPSLPGWTPFAAAGGAITGTEGLKRMRERYLKFKLEKRLRTGLNTPEPSIV